MFFQEAPTPDPQPAQESNFKTLKDEATKTLLESYKIGELLLKIESQSTRINSIFGQNRQRIDEITRAVQDSSVGIIKMGGKIEDVGDTIIKISGASRRNVIESKDVVENLFASSKILGTSVDKIASSFLDVGVNLKQSTDEIGSSVKYIQSVGGNVSQIFGTVLENTERLNRFQFENGVQGLTKMAAQASMLRFDMGQTFELAEKVLTPEGAIETAAAFQRLGVSAGNLTDPFQLMNLSINDPQGLQDSLVEVSKQFTYFDEKTKSFKINPQGVLTLKEIEKQTGVSAKELSKLGLAASELDQRLSQISPSIEFKNEEDRQYLANIGRMGEGGQYEVSIKDEKGQEQTKKLSELTQTEFDKLISEQKDGQKSVIETAKDQLSLTNLILGELKALVVQNQLLVSNTAGLDKEIKLLRGSVETFNPEKINNGLEIVLKPFGKTIKEAIQALKDIIEKGFEFPKELPGADVISKAGGITRISTTEGELIKLSPNDDVAAAPNLIKNLNEMNLLKNSPVKYEPLTNVMSSIKPESIQTNSIQTNSKQTVEFTGSPTITVKHEFSGEFSNLSREVKMKIADEIVNSPQLVSQIQSNFAQMNESSTFRMKNPLNTTFGSKS